jgi:hypothetical protein
MKVTLRQVVMAFGLSAGVALAGGSDAQRCIALPGNLPPAVAAPASARAMLELHARGEQFYVCRALGDGGFGWTFEAPRAALSSGCAPDGPVLATHFAGPTWRWEADQSEWVGNAAAAAKAAAPDDAGSNIPWLLLPKKSASDGGALSAFRYVQRVQTRGGVAPSKGCGARTAGADAGVPYQANYIFYE